MSRRRGCRVTLFGEPRGPLRDNLDEAREDAIRLKLGRYDEYDRFFLDAPVAIEWEWIEARQAA